MKRFSLIFPLVLFGLTIDSNAEEQPFRLIPNINYDFSVTLQVKAPGAKEVRVIGFGDDSNFDWSVSNDGIYSVTTPPLKPDMYMYCFEVDGVRTLDPINPYTVRDISSVFNKLIIPGGNADLFLVQDVPHGDVATVWYDSSMLGKSRRMTVYTPAGYTDDKEKHYPVFYLIHGMGGDEKAWNELGLASNILDNMIASGLVEPMIVVMPNGNAELQATPGESSKGFYSVSGKQSVTEPDKFEKSMTDIVEYIDSNYRTIPDKKSRAIAELSMGGGQTARIGMLMPDMFAYWGLFSAAEGWNGEGVSPLNENDIELLKLQKKADPELYWIGIGKDDFLYTVNADYRKILDSIGFEYKYHESEGGHTWNNWRDYLILFTPLLFRK